MSLTKLFSSLFGLKKDVQSSSDNKSVGAMPNKNIDKLFSNNKVVSSNISVKTSK
ncbi:MAG: hypothetical protein MJ211_13915 [Bacteroidales bacterium]|nr:hypothetical protein [Bacteroidales bacterium]